MLFSVGAAAAVFLALFFGLQWHIALCTVLAVGVYFGLFLLLKPTRRLKWSGTPFAPEEEKVEQLFEEAADDMRVLKEAASTAKSPGMRKQAGTLYQTGARILHYLMENPEKTAQARRFFTYYLDTAARLLARALEFERTGLRSREVTGVLQKTEAVLPVLQEAFERQFTNLMHGELMDVEADISVLESMIHMEDKG